MSLALPPFVGIPAEESGACGELSISRVMPASRAVDLRSRAELSDRKPIYRSDVFVPGCASAA